MANPSLDIAVGNLKKTRQFNNDHQGKPSAVHYNSSLKSAGIILEATSRLEIHPILVLSPYH
jgi:hypothetical protein